LLFGLFLVLLPFSSKSLQPKIGFAGVSGTLFFFRRKRKMNYYRYFDFNQKPSQPSLKIYFINKKGRENILHCLSLYGRFLSRSIVTANPIAIAIIIATIPGSMY